MIPKKLIDEINRWMIEKRYGNLQINFSGGKIVNINRAESLKVEMLAPDLNVNFTVTGSSAIPID